MFFFNPLFKVTVIDVYPIYMPAVMVLVPIALPLNYAMDVLLDFQDTMESPFASPLTFRTVVFCLNFSGNFAAVTLIVGVSLLPLFLVSFGPHTLQVLA